MENSPYAIPVTIHFPEGGIYVHDHDAFENGTFELRIEGDDGIFYLQPRIVQNEANVLIRVARPSKLDYENLTQIDFDIVAIETKTAEQHSSRSRVSVHLVDTNDNFPQFTLAHYNASVREDATEGTTVAWIEATDVDTGDGGVVYYYLLGAGRSHFEIDELTGELRVAAGAKLDRETVSTYYLTVEARDARGHGNRNSTQLEVALTDVSDNPPVFESTLYEGFLIENDEAPPTFRRTFVVKATSKDQPPISDISYYIITGDDNDSIAIDQTSGRITAVKSIDYEAMEENSTDHDLMRHFTLTVLAVGNGSPALNATATVIIFVEDANDNRPIFDQDVYWGSVQEDAPEGTQVVNVTASDGDGSVYNSRLQYRILHGAGDKFIITEDGWVVVGPLANLDPDQSVPRTASYNSDFSSSIVTLFCMDLSSRSAL
ncbi:PREDICTED: cadherin-23-like [Priapulus caudatus]|uniref:Cadherin-23-like n=1 Tax=Priapulus caudatus TaxID=37621 RepID=A0ABM1EWK2_PRICU|nr:PREDICTED: cadherin-23-like [Priapulus caudatus]